jgi:hypothetical protein
VAQLVVAAVAAVLDLMVVVLVLVARRLVRIAPMIPAPPVPQVLHPQEVLGGQEIQHLNPLFLAVLGAQGVVAELLVVRAKLL